MQKFKQVIKDIFLPILTGSGMGVAIASIITNNTTTGIIGGVVMVIGWIGLKVATRHAK
jgi:hypothetical protein